MATTKLWKVENRLDNVVNYASDKSKTENKKYQNINNIYELLDYTTNPDKTEKQFFVTGINCELDTAIRQMTQTKKKFNKDKYSKNNKIVAFHGYQSFAEGEVTPEIAHEIGVKLAEEMWGDRFEVVVSTHLNTDHIHNHFVLNSVSFKDGKKYYSNFENTALLRKTSDDICDEYGLKVLDEKTCKSGINFENFYRKSLSNSDYYKFAKEDIDYAIEHSWSYKEFIKRLKDMGYEIYFRAEKISIRRYPHKRNIRIERAFGNEYSIENINTRIENTHTPRVPFIESYNQEFKYEKEYKKNKAHGLYGLYKHYCYILKVYPIKYPRKILPLDVRIDVSKLEEISKQTRLLVREKIETHEQFLFYKEKVNREVQDLIGKKHNLWIKHKRAKTEEEKISVREEINTITKELEIKRKEVVLCDDIEKRMKGIEENVKELEEEKGKERKL